MLFEPQHVIGVAGALVPIAIYLKQNKPTEAERASKLLEDVFFSSDGVIALVDIYARGQEPPDAMKETILTEFSDWEDYSDSLKELLNADELFKGYLTIGQRDVLENIGYKKVQVRDAVKCLLGGGYGKVPSAGAKQILRDIKRLNKAVIAAQKVLKA